MADTGITYNLMGLGRITGPLLCRIIIMLIWKVSTRGGWNWNRMQMFAF